MNKYELENLQLSSQNALYRSMYDTWLKNEIVYNGEEVVKSFQQDYLLATKSMANEILQSGTQNKYDMYLNRAVMPDFFIDTIESSCGVLTAKPPQVKYPVALEGMSELADTEGSGMSDLVNSIYREQLKVGRVGVALVADTMTTYPLFKTYDSLCVLDWRTEREVYDAGEYPNRQSQKLKAVLVCEPTYINSNKMQKIEWVYTVYAIDGSGRYYTQTIGEYLEFYEFDFDNPVGQNIVYPAIKGKGYQGDELPFVIFNTTKLGVDVERVRLQGIVERSLQYYRNSADYEQQLHLSAQDTLVATGISKGDQETINTGAGNFIYSTNKDAKFGYIGIEGTGIGAAKENLQDIKDDVAGKSITFLAGESNNQSGVALEIKRSATTANLTTIADTLRDGMKKLLGFSAKWLGASIDQVEFDSNRDFSRGKVTVEELVQLWGAKQQGLPISQRDIFKIQQQGGFSEADNFDEQLSEMSNEEMTGGIGEEE